MGTMDLGLAALVSDTAGTTLLAATGAVALGAMALGAARLCWLHLAEEQPWTPDSDAIVEGSRPGGTFGSVAEAIEYAKAHRYRWIDADFDDAPYIVDDATGQQWGLVATPYDPERDVPTYPRHVEQWGCVTGWTDAGNGALESRRAESADEMEAVAVLTDLRRAETAGPRHPPRGRGRF